MPLTQRNAGGKQFRFKIQQLTKMVVFVWKNQGGVNLWSHPNQPHLRHIRVNLLLEYLASFLSVIFDILQ